MGVRDDLIASGVHPRALWCVSNEAVYVSGGRQEYRIIQTGPTWKIQRYRNGKMCPQLSGSFTSFKIAETRLISFLRSKDKWGKAIYPGKELNGKG